MAAFKRIGALRYRDFRLLWLGQLVSIAGSQMRIVAVNWQIYQLAVTTGAINPALALGLIGLARVLAIVVSAPLSGLLADRLDRRMLLVWTSVLALLTSAVLAVATQFGFASVWLIYAMVLVAAVAGAFEQPARQALLPSLVPPAELPNALSLNIIAWQLATVIGPTIAGILIAAADVGIVYWLDAASFLAVIATALLVRAPSAPARVPPVTLQAALDGLRFVFRTRLIASTMLLDFFATFFGAAMTLLPLFADQVLKVGPAELGWLYAAPSVGAVIAAVLLAGVRIPHQGPVLLWAVVVYGLSTSVFGLSTSLWLTLLALAVGGAADTVSMVIRGTIRQLRTPDELRGRMTSVNMIFFMGGPQLGELQAGATAALIGGPLTVAIGGVLCALSVWGIARWDPELRAYQGPDEEPVAARQTA